MDISIKIFTIYLLCLNTLRLTDGQSVKWSFGSYIFPNNRSLEFRVTITSPAISGTYPVIFFLTGLDGIVDTEFYDEFLTDLATKNNKTIIIGFDKFRFPMLPDKEETLFELTLNWATENLKTFFNTDKTPDSIRNKVFPDSGPNGYTLMSHSAGAHPTCLYLSKHCNQFKKLIWIDPVDGFDPFGMVKIYCTNPPNVLPFKIPTLVISTGLDPIKVNDFTPACAPNNISNNRFYESLAGPTFYFNFTEYGHADIIDDWIRKDAAYICRSCEHDKKDCDYITYRENLSKSVSIFIYAVDEKNVNYMNAIKNPAKSGLFNSTINIISKYNENGFNILDTGSFCIHS